MIVLDDSPSNLPKLFDSLQKVVMVYHLYSMPYEHFDVYLSKGLHQPLAQIWPSLKKWN